MCRMIRSFWQLYSIEANVTNNNCPQFLYAYPTIRIVSLGTLVQVGDITKQVLHKPKLFLP